MDKYNYIDRLQFRISENNEELYNIKYAEVEKLTYNIKKLFYLDCSITDNTPTSISFIVYDVDYTALFNAVLNFVNIELNRINNIK